MKRSKSLALVTEFSTRNAHWRSRDWELTALGSLRDKDIVHRQCHVSAQSYNTIGKVQCPVISVAS